MDLSMSLCSYGLITQNDQYNKSSVVEISCSCSLSLVLDYRLPSTQWKCISAEKLQEIYTAWLDKISP